MRAMKITATTWLLLSTVLSGCGGDDEDMKVEEVEGKRDAGEPRETATTLPATPEIETGCDMTANQQTRCGDTDCPTPQAAPAGACGFVSCCTTDNACGVRSAATLNGRPVVDFCIPQAMADARCPPVGLGLMSVPGCCDGSGRCGQLIGTFCLASATARACDADAGI